MWLLARLGSLLGSRAALYGGIILVGLLSILYAKFWSCAAVLKKVEVKEAAIAAELKAEAEGLKADYTRINATPHQTHEELLRQLNESASRLRHKP